jgi:hypothetical protein
MNSSTRKQLRRPTRPEVNDIVVWLSLTLGLGLLPTWGGAFVKFVWAKPLDLADFVIHGEFALYTASIVSGTCYIVCRDLPGVPFPFRPWFVVTTVFLALWAGLISGGLFLGATGPPSVYRLAWLTIPTFIVAIFLSMLAMALERQISLPDPHGADIRQITDLEQRVRQRRPRRTSPRPAKAGDAPVAGGDETSAEGGAGEGQK